MASTTATGDKSKSDDQPADMAALEAQIAQLRADLSALTDTIGDIGKSRASQLKGEARARAAKARASAEDAFDTISARAHEVEDEVALRIRERPFMALGIAAAVGFVAAMIARR